MPITVRCQVTRVSDRSRTRDHDTLAAEEPLEIRVEGRPLAVTMRTPGHDFELAAGFLLTEGLVSDASEIRTIGYCGPERPGQSGGRGPESAEEQRFNVVDVGLATGVTAPSPSAARAFVTSSACGLCGKSSIDTVRARSRYDVAADPCSVSAATLAALPDRLRRGQRVFARTGGLHAAGLFGGEGELICLREDVGRHNAFDKVIGWAALERRLPLRSHVILASGRASFELVQKAVMAGIPVMTAVSAPSSLAVELATQTGMTLVGFLRGETMNVYAGAHRVH